LIYDSFGNLLSQSDADFATRYLFTGRELDAETGLYYYRARYYDAALGRFLSEDPFGFAAGDANLFRYVRNSPLNSTDPFGEECPDPPRLRTRYSELTEEEREAFVRNLTPYDRQRLLGGPVIREIVIRGISYTPEQALRIHDPYEQEEQERRRLEGIASRRRPSYSEGATQDDVADFDAETRSIERYEEFIRGMAPRDRPSRTSFDYIEQRRNLGDLRDLPEEQQNIIMSIEILLDVAPMDPSRVPQSRSPRG
jgi:RHS repeat-associated protein